MTKSSSAGKLLMIFLIVFISGCDTTKHREAWDKTYRIPVDSTVQLFQPLTIRARHTQVFIQNGSTEHPKRLFGLKTGHDEYYPFCYFELADISKSPQMIDPDIFTITEVYQDETQIVSTGSQRLHSPAAVGDGDGDRSLTMVFRLFVMHLHSNKQPHVKKLACTSGYEFDHWAKLPTLKEIHDALGEIARLDTSAGKTDKAVQ